METLVDILLVSLIILGLIVVWSIITAILVGMVGVATKKEMPEPEFRESTNPRYNHPSYGASVTSLFDQEKI